MNLVSIRIITENVMQLVAFYQKVTNLKAVQFTEDFAEIRTPSATLAIGSIQTLAFFTDTTIAEAAQNRSAIIELICPDVDVEYDRLQQDIASQVIQIPTIMPWGNKSLLFRDPDGNLVNLFSPVSEAALLKFEGKF
ncbi:Catechol 2,3-dioxygenase [Flexibacter flexilis DSM 6793]|uniref:Catechol 2,3-dioxygenase n=1 Tax=Flexibacter flexilis DSM 6793 TaxID=927664 RepID=A0A1I1DWH8_9BACT|nr:VOC family protein [Flexibacter flexilis]SFB77378.1 Catechol 2,3-dioxygenase [Flexibacter flexilis DSM 6793]